MLKLTKVSLRNFMSYGNVPTILDLDKTQTVMIIGENRDIGEAGNSKNGVGKSSAIQGVIFGLYGKGIDKLKSDEFINFTNGKQLEVEVYFEISGKSYRVKRTRKPNAVELYLIEGDTETSLTRDSMKNTDDLISEIIGMPYEVFVGVYFMSPHKESFMAMSGPDQRSFIENVLSLDVLAKRAESLKLMRKEAQVESNTIKRELESATIQNEKIETQIQSLVASSATWESKQSEKKQHLESELERLKSIDFEGQEAKLEQLWDISSRLNEISDEMTQLIRSDVSARISQFVGVRSNVEQLQQQADAYYSDIEDAIKSVEDQLDELDLEGIEDSIEQLESVQVRITELTATRNSLTRDLTSLERELDTEAHKCEKLADQIEVLASGVCPFCSQSHVDKEKLASMEDQYNKMVEAVEALDKKVFDKNAQIDTVDTELTELNEIDLGKLSGLREDNKTATRLVDKLESLYEKKDQTNPYTSSIESALKSAGVSDVDELTATIEELGLRKETDSATKCKLEVDQLKLKETQATLKSELIFDSLGTLQSKKKEIGITESAISELQNEENPYTEQIKSTESLFVDIDKLVVDLEELEKIDKHIGYLIKLLTDSKSFVRKNILDQYIPFLNKKILEYTTKLDLPHIGTINSDLSVNLSYMGKDVSYYNTSRGERLRLDIAVTAAFKDLMKLLGKDCNMLMVDELFDGSLDSGGMYKSFNFVKERANHVWLISHRDELVARVDKQMKVIKQNGFTTIDWSEGGGA